MFQACRCVILPLIRLKSLPFCNVVHELESLGYSWAHRIISLSAFGLPQRRHRVFIVATLHGDPRDVLLSTESICKGQCINLSKAESKEKSPAECYECFMTPPHVTPTISVTCDLAEKRYGPVAHEICTLTASNGRRLCMVEDLGDGRGHAFRLEIEDAERLNGFPVGWTESCYPLMIPGRPWMKAVDSYRSYTKRIELLGRAVAIPQARWIGRRLMSPYEIKFSRESDGINFSEPVPGLSSITKEDSGTEAKLRHGLWLHGIFFLVQKTFSCVQNMTKPLHFGAVDEASNVCQIRQRFFLSYLWASFCLLNVKILMQKNS